MDVHIILSFDENDLGPKWMNIDNLALLLYTEHKTKKELLKIVSYEEIEQIKTNDDEEAC